MDGGNLAIKPVGINVRDDNGVVGAAVFCSYRISQLRELCLGAETSRDHKFAVGLSKIACFAPIPIVFDMTMGLFVPCWNRIEDEIRSTMLVGVSLSE